MEIDLETKATTNKVQLRGWTRGLAVSDNYFLVGESCSRHKHDYSSSASIAVVDRSTWQVVERTGLPCGEIYDIIQLPKELAEPLMNASYRKQTEQLVKDGEILKEATEAT